jgi:small-conductance mechanosensitive channel
MVGRELRLRMKEAFEKAGINIGIPQQAFFMAK